MKQRLNNIDAAYSFFKTATSIQQILLDEANPNV